MTTTRLPAAVLVLPKSPPIAVTRFPKLSLRSAAALSRITFPTRPFSPRNAGLATEAPLRMVTAKVSVLVPEPAV